MSVTSIVGERPGPPNGSGIVPAPAPSFATNCQAPAGVFVSSPSQPDTVSKKTLPPLFGAGATGLAGGEGTLPAKTLLLDRGGFGLGPDQVVVACTVRLAKAVAADDQRGRLLVVHRHAAERLANVNGRGQGIGLALWAFRIHIDQAHRRRAERLREIAFAGITLVGAQPLVLFAEEDLLGLPDIRATEAEAEGLEPHRLQRAVTGEHQQVGPRDLAAVLLLHRPQQPARLVQVCVVGPAVERCETLGALAAATSAVENAVGARRMPAHPDEQAAVVAVVGGPPVLRLRHHCDDVGLERLDVELLELLRVVEVLTQRVGLGRVRVQLRHVDLLWPPILVGQGSVRLRFGRGGCRVFAVRHEVHPYYLRWVNGAVITGVIAKLAMRCSRGTDP